MYFVTLRLWYEYKYFKNVLEYMSTEYFCLTSVILEIIIFNYGIQFTYLILLPPTCLFFAEIVITISEVSMNTIISTHNVFQNKLVNYLYLKQNNWCYCEVHFTCLNFMSILFSDVSCMYVIETLIMNDILRMTFLHQISWLISDLGSN